MPSLSDQNEDTDLELAKKFIPNAQVLSELSARVICKHFVSNSLRVEEKEDKSIVTIADREAESQMRDYLARTFPNHGIVGEEFGEQNKGAEFVWYLDPIDGTISFVAGVPLFGTLIGLCYQGKPILGVIHQPILNQLCIGTNSQCTLNGRPVRVNNETQLGNSTLLTTDYRSIEKHQPQSQIDSLAREVKHMRTWGDCYGYLMLSCGRAEIMLDPIMNPWDIIPVIPVVKGAGGVISDWNGKDPTNANSCVAATPKLHSKVLRILSAS